MLLISEDEVVEASTFCNSFDLSIIGTIRIHLYYQRQFLRCTHMRCRNKLHTYHCVLLFHNDRYNYNFYIYSLTIPTAMAIFLATLLFIFFRLYCYDCNYNNNCATNDPFFTSGPQMFSLVYNIFHSSFLLFNISPIRT